MVNDTTPPRHRFEFELWTLGLIQELLERQFPLRLARSTLGRAMNASGFTPRCPLGGASARESVLLERGHAK